MTSFADLLLIELNAIPSEQWGFFFPCHVASWRFIRERRPDLLGDIDCGYDDDPWFKGKGASWFVSSVIEDPEYLEGVEAIMYALAEKHLRHGFVNRITLDETERRVLEQVERALQRFTAPGA